MDRMHVYLRSVQQNNFVISSLDALIEMHNTKFMKLVTGDASAYFLFLFFFFFLFFFLTFIGFKHTKSDLVEWRSKTTLNN